MMSRLLTHYFLLSRDTFHSQGMNTSTTNTIHHQRDNDLDTFRGWVMIYIVGFIHTISATIFNWYTDTYATLLLIEMPIIFYISGASYSISSKKNYDTYVKNRIKRIIIPLVIYLLTYTLGCYISGNIPFKEVVTTLFTFISSVIQNKTTVLSHLWFIHPYFIIALMLPLLHYISKRVNSMAIYLSLIVLLVILYFYPNYVLCYIIPTFAGLYYRQTKPYNRYIILIIMLMSIIVCYKQGCSWNMQLNKFPSNLMFISYCIAVLILISEPLKWCCKQLTRIPAVNYIVQQYARYDYTIYLYHIHVISAVTYAYAVLIQYLGFTPHKVIAHIIISTITLLCMIPIGKFFTYINNKVIEGISHLYHYPAAKRTKK